MFDSKIIKFIKEHHVMTIASSSNNDLWCANVFYTFSEEIPGFIITSNEETRHIRTALDGDNMEVVPTIAGSIVLETETIGLIRGLQFRTEIRKVNNSLLNKYKLLYLKRFPYALLKDSELWIMELIELKYTDNRLGFGKKILWSRE